MKLTNFVVHTVVKAVNGSVAGGERKAQREARMRAYWRDPQNAQLIVLGYFLREKVNGRTLADYMVHGEEIEMSDINGFPLQEGFKLSLRSIRQWGCPACHSAHGSGVGMSKEKDAAALADNKFFYNPQTKALFTISATCWGNWVRALNAATDERFISLEQYQTMQRMEAMREKVTAQESKKAAANK